MNNKEYKNIYWCLHLLFFWNFFFVMIFYIFFYDDETNYKYIVFLFWNILIIISRIYINPI